MNLNDLKPGRELDALVAEKVMGLNVKPVFHAKSTEPLDLKPGAFYQMVDGWSIPYIPDYSTSIADAWLVVENIRLQGREMSLYFCQGIIGYTCYFGEFSYKENTILTHGETAPHAICLASLKSVGYVPCEKD